MLTPPHPNPLPVGEGTIGQRLWAYAELVRLPNLPTAAADVMMGYVVTHGSLRPAGPVSLLVAASCLLYLAGMVLNDVQDAAVDACERPGRPIPSGRVSRTDATALGWALLASGVLVAWFASYWTGEWRPGLIGSILAGSILLYDFVLKRTPIGPLVMGACRALNVLLGMSLASDVLAGRPRAWTSAEWIIALGIGAYIAGLTWFARTEAERSSRLRLTAGMIVLLAGMAMVASLPLWLRPGAMIAVADEGWYLLWAVLALVIARRCTLAIARPGPRRVQAAVRSGLHSLIMLDAVVSLPFGGVYWACAVLVLLAPTLVLAQVFDST
jgi:4-hydroxybenzoate polyprenyltransferase